MVYYYYYYYYYYYVIIIIIIIIIIHSLSQNQNCSFLATDAPCVLTYFMDARYSVALILVVCRVVMLKCDLECRLSILCLITTLMLHTMTSTHINRFW